MTDVSAIAPEYLSELDDSLIALTDDQLEVMIRKVCESTGENADEHIERIRTSLGAQNSLFVYDGEETFGSKQQKEALTSDMERKRTETKNSSSTPKNKSAPPKTKSGVVLQARQQPRSQQPRKRNFKPDPLPGRPVKKDYDDDEEDDEDDDSEGDDHSDHSDDDEDEDDDDEEEDESDGGKDKKKQESKGAEEKAPPLGEFDFALKHVRKASKDFFELMKPRMNYFFTSKQSGAKWKTTLNVQWNSYAFELQSQDSSDQESSIRKVVSCFRELMETVILRSRMSEFGADALAFVSFAKYVDLEGAESKNSTGGGSIASVVTVCDPSEISSVVGHEALGVADAVVSGSDSSSASAT
jgi:hypothetical protein